MTVIDLLNEYSSLIGLVAPPLCGWIWWSARKSFAGKGELAAVQAANAAILARLEALEANMPDNETMLSIRLSLQELRGDMKATDAKLDGMKTSIEALSSNTIMLMQHHLGEE